MVLAVARNGVCNPVALRPLGAGAATPCPVPVPASGARDRRRGRPNRTRPFGTPMAIQRRDARQLSFTAASAVQRISVTRKRRAIVAKVRANDPGHLHMRRLEAQYVDLNPDGTGSRPAETRKKDAQAASSFVLATLTSRIRRDTLASCFRSGRPMPSRGGWSICATSAQRHESLLALTPRDSGTSVMRSQSAVESPRCELTSGLATASISRDVSESSSSCWLAVTRQVKPGTSPVPG